MDTVPLISLEWAPQSSTDLSGAQSKLFSMEIQACVNTGKSSTIQIVKVSKVLSFSCMCIKCGKCFVTKSSLKPHVENHSQSAENVSDTITCMCPSSDIHVDKNTTETSGVILKLPVEMREVACGSREAGRCKVEACNSRADGDVPADNSRTDSNIGAESTVEAEKSRAGSNDRADIDDGADFHRMDNSHDSGEIDGDDVDDDGATHYDVRDGDRDGRVNVDRDCCNRGEVRDGSYIDGADDKFIMKGIYISKLNNYEPVVDGFRSSSDGTRSEIIESAMSGDTGTHVGGGFKRPGHSDNTKSERINMTTSDVRHHAGIMPRQSESHERTFREKEVGGDRQCDECTNEHRGQKPEAHLNVNTLDHRGEEDVNSQITVHCTENTVGQLHSEEVSESQLTVHRTEYSANRRQSREELRSQLAIHSCEHTGHFYSCKECDKLLKEASDLKEHNSIHAGNKPHKSHFCSVCGKSYRRKCDATIHMRSHTGVRPHPCILCGKSFNSLSLLKIHTRVHTGERPYTCNTCGKGFKNPNHLKVHIRIHTGEKPYVCVICDKRFTDGSHLKRHLRSNRHKDGTTEDY